MLRETEKLISNCDFLDKYSLLTAMSKHLCVFVGKVTEIRVSYLTYLKSTYRLNWLPVSF